jgi:uncharacterized protein YxjI
MPGWLPVAGGDAWIMNDLGQAVHRIDGAALRLRDAVVFRNTAGDEVCSVRLRVDRLRTSIEIEGPDGQRLATVTKTPISPLRDRFVVTVGDDPAHKVEGNVLGHEYRIGDAARVSPRWFRVSNTYGVEVAPGHDEVLMLAATVCIDWLVGDFS